MSDPNNAAASGMSSIIMIVLMFAIIYFFMIRPENKRKKKAMEMRESIKKGDVVTTIGGIVGKVVQVNSGTLIMETSEDRVRVEVTKWAVSSIGIQSSEVPQIDKQKKKKEEDGELPEELE